MLSVMVRSATLLRSFATGLTLLIFGAALAREPAEPIEVLVSSDTNIYATGLIGLQSVVGVPLRIRYLDSLIEEEPDLEGYFRRLEQNQAPLVITVGPGATRIALDHLEKTPVLFSMVHSPRSFNPAAGRICGVSMDISISEYFRTLKEIAPGARRVQAFYSARESEYTVGEGEYLDLRYGLHYARVRVERKDRFFSVLENQTGGVDAVYMIPDPLYDQERFEQLSAYCKKNKIVLMTGFASLVRAGATFGITPDYGRVGVLTGEMANRVLSGQSNCAKEGVGFVDQTAFYLNESFASESGVVVPETIKERARLTRLFNAGVNFMNTGKLKSARIVFDAILARDPDNRPASGYRRMVIERQTGAQTGALLAAARKYYAEENYPLAIRDFKRVMDINPNHDEAVRGYRQGLLAQSERDRQRGLALLRAGQPFDAIKQFQTALQGYPGNEQAARDLAAARTAQNALVPDFTRDGINLYNEREYGRAIVIFENILLVQPGHNKATEYLRLSKKKQAAIERLMNR